MLLLFDIDGTLVSCGGAGRRALERAFLLELEVERALEDVRLDGSTDPTIVAHAFQARLGRPPEPGEQARVLERYLAVLTRELVEAGPRYRVLPGATSLVRQAAQQAGFVLGLATGNVERGARIKLDPAGLNPYFSFGGYGSDSAHRGELVLRAIERGQGLAERRARRFAPAEILVIGDTELDVRAAREAGATAVGVLCGCRDQDALRRAGPDLLVESLADPILWRALGLGAPPP